jgi:hypothetical protein
VSDAEGCRVAIHLIGDTAERRGRMSVHGISPGPQETCLSLVQTVMSRSGGSIYRRRRRSVAPLKVQRRMHWSAGTVNRLCHSCDTNGSIPLEWSRSVWKIQRKGAQPRTRLSRWLYVSGQQDIYHHRVSAPTLRPQSAGRRVQWGNRCANIPRTAFRHACGWSAVVKRVAPSIAQRKAKNAMRYAALGGNVRPYRSLARNKTRLARACWTLCPHQRVQADWTPGSQALGQLACGRQKS